MAPDHKVMMGKLLNEPDLAAHLRRREVARGKHVWRQGEVTRDVFLVEKGLVKLYYVTVDGNERIKSFVTDGELFGSRISQVYRQGSPFAAVCLESTQLLVADYDPFRQALMTNAQRMAWLFNLTEQTSLKKELREYHLLCLSAQERYEAFLADEPELARRLSQADTARYLGITAIALSRIRRRLGLSGGARPE